MNPAILHALLAASLLTPTLAPAAEPIRTVTGFSGTVVSIKYSPDGGRLAVADESSKVHVVDAKSGKTLHSIDGYESPGSQLAWSTDSSRVFRLGNNEWIVSDADGRNRRAVACGFSGCRQLALSPDGKTVAVSGSGKVGLWDAASAKPIATGEPHPNWRISHLAFTHKGNRLVTASDDRSPRWLILPTLEPGNPELVEQATKPVALQSRPGADAVALLNRDSRIHRLDLATMTDRWIEVRCPEVLALAISADGDWIGIAGGTEANFIHWDSSEERRIRITNTALGFRSLAFSPDSRHVALGDHDSKIRVWIFADLEQPK